MMKATWASIALTLAGSATNSLFAGDLSTSEGSTELISKVYDLGHLRVRDREYESEGVILFPPSRTRVPMGEAHWMPLEDSFVGMVGNVLWEEIEYDGRALDSSGNETLYLKAPASTHANVKELMKFYERLCTADTQIQLYWVQVPEGSPAPSGLVPVDKAASWVGAQPVGSYRADKLSVPAYRAGVLGQMQETPVLVDSNIEIAQGTATLDDVVRRVGSGRWAMVHAVPNVGGLQMSITWADMQEPELTDTSLEIKALIGSEGNPAELIDLRGSIQLMHQNSNIASTRAFVPDGMASISKVASKDGISTLLVAIPHSRAPLEQSYQLEGPRKDRGVAFLIRSLAPLQTEWNMESSFNGVRSWTEDWCFRSQVDTSEWLVERALEGISDDLVSYTEVGGYVVLYTAHGVVRDQLTIANMELDRAAQRLRSLVARGVSYKVTLTGYSGDHEEIFELEQVVAEGARSTWFSGAERTFIEDYDVEVAQFAAIHEPNVASRMEGSLVQLLVGPDDGEGLNIQIDARMSLPRGRRELKGASPMHANVIRDTFQETRINVVRRITETDGKGIWNVKFGGFADGAIHLDLKVELVK